MLSLPWEDQIRAIAYDLLRKQEELDHEMKILEAQIPKNPITHIPRTPSRRRARKPRRG